MNTHRISQKIDIPLFHTISEVAAEHGVQAFIVGGYVRDILLQRDSKDLDIVVDKDGLGFAELLASRLEGTKVNLFQKFGTAQFIANDLEVEIVGARKESYRYDSRKPLVENGTLEEDRLRRDFTINAMTLLAA